LSRAQWSAEQCRVLSTPQSRHLRRAPAVGLLAGLLARAVPDKPTTADAKTTTTDAKTTTTDAKTTTTDAKTTTTEGGAQ